MATPRVSSDSPSRCDPMCPPGRPRIVQGRSDLAEIPWNPPSAFRNTFPPVSDRRHRLAGEVTGVRSISHFSMPTARADSWSPRCRRHRKVIRDNAGSDGGAEAGSVSGPEEVSLPRPSDGGSPLRAAYYDG